MKEEEGIQIPDDDEMMVENQKAVIAPIGTTAFDVQFKINMEETKKIIIDEPEKQLIKRLRKFYQYNKVIEPGKQHFRPRRQADYRLPDTQLLETQIVLFGSDFIKFKQLKEMFGAISCNKIDDSNCRLVFASFEKAWSGIGANIADPSILAMKSESEDWPPRCWFQMKPYIHLQSEIDMHVRFATSTEQIETQNEGLLKIYVDSKEIFNYQQRIKLRDDFLDCEKKKEKLEIRKQKTSANLYDHYENRAKDWNAGKNKNPGANRRSRSKSRQRQRSREKNHMVAQINNDEREEVSSNCSYVLKKINEKLDGIQLQDKSNEKQELNLSYDLNVGANQKEGGLNTSYRWAGDSSSANHDRSYKFNYRQYIKQKQEQEEKRRNLITIITID